MLAKHSLTQSYAFRPDVVATLLDDGAVLLDLESKFFYRLNRTGWAIAQLFESGASLAAAYALARRLGAPASDDEHINSVVELLHNDRLVETIDALPAQIDENDPSVEAAWVTPSIEKQAEPLQRVIISAFDPSVPLVE